MTTRNPYHPDGLWPTAGSYTRTAPDPDDMDGGVTAALVEKEAEKHDAAHDIDWQAVAEQHEDTIKALIAERDEALYQRDQWMRANDSTRDILDEAIEERRRIARALDLPENATADAMVKHAAESRPLTPDAITDEMVERARNAPSFDGRLSPTPRIVREMLTAALTEPPSRPEGAEELGELIGEYLDSTPDTDDKGMADFLAEHGVRVVTEERS